MAQALRRRYPFIPPEGAVDHLVIGAGIVGLAIARRLARLEDKTTYVAESARNEASSRNSGVIHAGIYYPRDSLKTKLCCRGRRLMYAFADERGVPYRKTQKLVIATSPEQHAHLRDLHQHASSLPPPIGPVPVELIDGETARKMEPDLHENVSGALLSTETGIVDAHALCEAFETDVRETGAGELVYGTSVVRIDRMETAKGKRKRGDSSDEGWVVQTVTEGSQPVAILAKSVINAAGLSAHHVINQILPEKDRRPLHYAKGSYFSYRGPGVSQVQRLLYPCPEAGLSGLGTHLTMNLAGEIRFGPDVEWLDPPAEGEEEHPDYWTSHLAPSEARLEACIEAVQRYLPHVRRDGFAPDYSGIRPKLSRSGFHDFEISLAAPGFVNLLGIESPGLTSSFAIAEMVEDIVKKQVWGLGVGRGKVVSETGSQDLNAWT